MAKQVKTVEIWDDVEANSGTRQSVIADWISATETLDLTGREKLALLIRRESDAWDDLDHRVVIRLVIRGSEDGSEEIEEWRVLNINDSQDAGGGLLGSIPCESIRYDLRATIIESVQADGRAIQVFGIIGRTPDELVDIVAAFFPSYIIKGTIEPTTVIENFTFQNDSPLSALQEIATLSGTELEFERNGSTNFKVHLRTETNSGAEKAYLRYSKNLTGVRRQSDGSKQTNVVFPVGATVDGVQATMREASWEVSAVSGGDIDLIGGPIAFNDQLNGFYLLKPDGTTLTLITDTVLASQRVVVASGAAISPGDFVQFRRNASGDDLTWLEDQASVATFGRIESVLERTDIPMITNVVPNAFLSDWTASVPDNFALIGTPTVTEETSDDFVKYGTSSARVQADVGEGLQTDAITIAPAATDPFFSAMVAFWLVSGSVKIRLVDATNTTEYPPADEDDKGKVNTTDRWTERLEIEGVDLNVAASTSVRILIQALEDSTEFYWDAAQLEQEAASAQSFMETRAANLLWLAANERLVARSQPLVKFDISLIDLERAFEDIFEFDELVLGGTVQVQNDFLDLDFSTRIIQIVRQKDLPGATRVVLSNSIDDLSGRLGTPGRRPRNELVRPGLPTLARFTLFNAFLNEDGDLRVQYALNTPKGLSVKYIASDTSAPSRDTVIASGTVVNSPATEFEALSNATAETDDTAFVTVVAFSGANGGGFPGASASASVIQTGVVTVSGTLFTEVVSDDLVDIFFEIGGPATNFPINWAIFADDPTTTAVASGTVFSATTIGPSDDTDLDDQVLPLKQHRKWWGTLTDHFSNEYSGFFASADRNGRPQGDNTVEDDQAQPVFRVEFDDDVEQIVFTVPGGTKTFSGLSGGGTQTYTVGVTTLDLGGTENDLAEGEERTGYKVVVSGNGQSFTIWEGAVHGINNEFETRYDEVTYGVSTATIEAAEAFLDDDNTGITLSFKDGGSAFADAPTNPDDITVDRPAIGADAKEVILAAKDGSVFRAQTSVTIQPEITLNIRDVDIAQVFDNGGGNDLDFDDMTFVLDGDVNTTDHDLTFIYYQEGALIDVETGIAVDVSQPRDHAVTGAGGVPGGDFFWVEIQIVAKSGDAVLDSAVSSKTLALT